MNREWLLGIVVWLALLPFASFFPGIATIECLFLFAPMVIVPMGFALLTQDKATTAPTPFLRWAIRLQPVAAMFVIGSFLPNAKPLTALLTLPWLAVCGLAALHGAANLLRLGVQFASAVTLFATGYLFGGSVWLFLSRAGINAGGFQEPIVLLTAVHFHYSGFAAVLVTGRLAARCEHDPRQMIWTRCFCIGTVLAIALTALGFLFSLPLKFAAICMLAVSLAGAALLTVWISPEMRVHAARVRLRVSSGAILAGMVLAILYGVGELRGQSVIPLHDMAIFHGALNAVGFTFFGLWGWNLLAMKEAQ